MRNFLKLQCLVDDLDEVDMGLRNEKKIVKYHLYRFFLKTGTDDLKANRN